MYGNVNGRTIEEVYANNHDSTIKIYLDNWYQTNIIDKNLEKYMADAGFCNDRSLSTQVGNGDGVQMIDKNSFYATYQRIKEKKHLYNVQI